MNEPLIDTERAVDGLLCNVQVSDGWRSHRCAKLAKAWAAGRPTQDMMPVCGIHLRMFRQRAEKNRVAADARERANATEASLNDLIGRLLGVTPDEIHPRIHYSAADLRPTGCLILRAEDVEVIIAALIGEGGS